ncbi:YbhB/YbcL family Raf kinase inhibitor-like protein [Nanoarchaeota archaeon]
MKNTIIMLIIAVLLLSTGCIEKNLETELTEVDRELSEIEAKTDKIVSDIEKEAEQFKFKITSSAFDYNTNIPSKYTCDGEDINPPLTIDNIPENTQSLVLIVDDPDAPIGIWHHWVVFDITSVNSIIETIPENSVPGKQGKNSRNTNDYHGPCPPSGTHRYFFKIYALDIKLNLQEGSAKQEVEQAMQGHILEQAELIGLYNKG